MAIEYPIESMEALLPPYTPKSCADCAAENKTEAGVAACLQTGRFFCAEHLRGRLGVAGHLHTELCADE